MTRMHLPGLLLRHSLLTVLLAAAHLPSPRTARRPIRNRAKHEAATPAGDIHHLPADVTTQHTLELPDRTLRFSATAGAIRLADDKGAPRADVAFIAYRLDGVDPRTRPVTFVFNGGPGMASGWLQVGRGRAMANQARRRCNHSLRVARSAAECRDLARFHRPGVHRSARHRLFAHPGLRR